MAFAEVYKSNAAHVSDTGLGSFGSLLRFWRTTQGLTQLELAHRAASTARYVSFLETGRSRPGENMVCRLADALTIPQSERCDFLIAAGYQSPLESQGMAKETIEPYRRAIHYTVKAHEPYPSFAINRWYDVVEKNDAANAMFGGDEPKDDINIIEAIFVDPEMRSRMANWATVATAMAVRLRREVASSPLDKRLQNLLDLAHDATRDLGPIAVAEDNGSILVCPVFRVGDKEIKTISMIARFGVSRELMADEIRVETIFPFDSEAEAFFEALEQGKVEAIPC